MKIGTLLISIFLGCGGGLAHAQPAEFKCFRAFAEMASQYPRLVCDGNELLERGRASEALEKYVQASKSLFFESPNFLIYYRISKAQSILGKKGDSNKTAKEFLDMLNIYDGTKSCSEPEHVEAKAIEIMCSESFGPEFYKLPKGSDVRKRISLAYRERIVAMKAGS